ncbi:hypothetical protein Tco_0860001 [Tanacetum coccineum]|uniref:Uncharacterized protein n=1 Tax=Tanacetum coccineum TaxID=301880 RepID=A0ABQ5BHM7_9ASTR
MPQNAVTKTQWSKRSLFSSKRNASKRNDFCQNATTNTPSVRQNAAKKKSSNFLYFHPSPSVAVVQEPVVSTGTPSSTRIDQDTPSTSTSQTHVKKQQKTISCFIPPRVEEDDSRNSEVAHMDNDLLLDHQIQQLSKGSSEGSGITTEVPDEPKDNSAVVAEKQAGYVQTNLTLSSAELEIQSMVDVPIHQEDLAAQRTPLIDPVISMVTEKTASTPTPPTT